MSSTDRHIDDARTLLTGRSLDGAARAYAIIAEAWEELERLGDVRAWYRLAGFVAKEWLPIAVEVGPPIREDDRRRAWYQIVRDTARSVIEGDIAFHRDGIVAGPSCEDAIGEECALLLDTLETFERAPVA